MSGIQVRATAVGYYGGEVKQPGDTFVLLDRTDAKGKVVQSAEDAFSEEWMEEVDGKEFKAGRRQTKAKVTMPTPAGTDGVEIRTPKSPGSNLDTDKDPARNTSPDPRVDG